MDRRTVLIAGGASLLAQACASVPGSAPDHALPQAGSKQHGRSDSTELALINRLTWGANSETVAAWSQGPWRDQLARQLNPASSPALPPGVISQIQAMTVQRSLLPALAAGMEQRRREVDAIVNDADKQAAQQAYQQELSRLAGEAASRMLLRALYSPNQLQEQLTWFWFNHFNVHQYKSNLRVMVGDYEDSVLRPHALGRFRDLLIGSATHAAMIRYLDNEQNAANHLNENYAREVMELHTLGVEGGYTQADVQNLARVLTGMGLNFTDEAPKLRPEQAPMYQRRGLTEFNPARHDMGSKTLLGHSFAGRGWDEILGELTRLAAHPATARHIATKLAAYMVADAPPPSLVDRMTLAFKTSDGDIAITLKAMCDAPEFLASLGRKFKDPVHYVVSALRLAYDGRVILNTAPAQGWLNRLGEGLYNRQTPDGYPVDEASWSGSGQMNARFEIARAIGGSSAGLFRSAGPQPVDTPAFPQLANAVYYQSIARTLGERTRAALDAATSASQWNAVLLSSPEFMYR